MVTPREQQGNDCPVLRSTTYTIYPIPRDEAKTPLETLTPSMELTDEARGWEDVRKIPTTVNGLYGRKTKAEANNAEHQHAETESWKMQVEKGDLIENRQRHDQ